jgi:hypothetical protein
MPFLLIMQIVSLREGIRWKSLGNCGIEAIFRALEKKV